MKNRSTLFLATSLLLWGFVSFATAPNLLARSFNAGYIISDSIFTNQTSMSANSIQDFIVSKGVYCSDGEAPCLKNFRENGKSAGTIIAEAATTYSINPQVLLVTLQKETGLVTINQPGAWRYKTAMGYGCPDTAECNSVYFGFTNQVNRAASMFHRIMTYDPTWYSPYSVGKNYVQWSPLSSCGGSNVTIVNRATAALYDYTPYQPNAASLTSGYGVAPNNNDGGCASYGNRNFWLYFNDWFGSSVSSMLIQSPQSPAVYLQSGNSRFGIASWDIIDAYGFGRFGVTAVSDEYMNSLADGGLLTTTFSNKASPGPVYLADNGYRFGFSSYQQCVDWGFVNCTSTATSKALEPSLFDQMYTYGDLGSLMLNGSYIHLMKDGKKYTFLSSQAKTEKGYGATAYSPITNRLNTSQPYGTSFPATNSLITFKNNPAIYAYVNNKFYTLTYEAFRGLVSSSMPVVVDDFSAYVSSAPSTAATVGSYIRFSNGEAYALTDGNKISISAVATSWPSQQTLDDLRTIVDARATDATATSTSTYRTSSGTIMRIENQKWRAFSSVSDYFALGYDNPIAVGDHVRNDMQAGNIIFAPGNGSLFQVTATGKEQLILTTSSDGTVCQIYTLPQLGLLGFDASSVVRISDVPSSTINLLGTVVYDEQGDAHIVDRGNHAVISNTNLVQQWGVQTRMNLCSLNEKFLARTTVSKENPLFVRDENTGVIYYGSNGHKQPIYSYTAFLRMGGNDGNTINVSSAFLSASPTGIPIQ